MAPLLFISFSASICVRKEESEIIRIRRSQKAWHRNTLAMISEKGKNYTSAPPSTSHRGWWWRSIDETAERVEDDVQVKVCGDSDLKVDAEGKLVNVGRS